MNGIFMFTWEVGLVVGGGGGGGTELGIEKSHLIRGYTCSRRLFSFQITVIAKIQLINICTGVDCIS